MCGAAAATRALRAGSAHMLYSPLNKVEALALWTGPSLLKAKFKCAIECLFRICACSETIADLANHAFDVDIVEQVPLVAMGSCPIAKDLAAFYALILHRLPI